MRVRLDRTWRRPGDGEVVVAGSPLRLFRLSEGGRHVAAQIEAGEVPDTAAVHQFVDRFVAAGALHPLPEPGAGWSIDDVTVVVPWHADASDGAAAARLAATVAALDGVRVVVVDDGSPQPVDASVATDDERVRIVVRGANGGPAAARNSGLAVVRTPGVVFVDSDVVLPAEVHAWLRPLLDHLGDERVALVAPRVASAPGTTAVARYEARRSPLDLGDEPARILAGTRVSYVPAAVLVARTAVVRDLGGFDEGLRFGEDVDLVWRLTESGRRARYEPSVVVHHLPRGSWAAVWRQRVGYGRSAAPLAARHRGALVPSRCSAWSLAVWALVLVRRPLLAFGLAVATAAALPRRLPSLPSRQAMRLVAEGHVAAGRQLAEATRRVWWPVALTVALLVRRTRLPLFAAVVSPSVAAALRDLRARRARTNATTVDDVREVLVDRATEAPRWLLDDLAYGCGVWRGVWETGELGAVLPAVTSWPPRGER